MTSLLLTVAILTAGAVPEPPALPSASDLVDRALAAHEALPVESRPPSEALIHALVDLGRDEEAYRVATAEPQYAESILRSQYGPRLARRLDRVPPEDELARIAPAGSPERDIALGKIARELAEAENPVAAEAALRLISERKPGPTNAVIAADAVAAAYRRAGDVDGERRVIRLGLEAAVMGDDTAFWLFDDLATSLTSRAAAVGEQEALRALLDAAVRDAALPEGLVATFPHHETAFWSRVGRCRTALGDRAGAEEAFAKATKCAEAYPKAHHEPIDKHYAIRNFVILASDLAQSGETEPADHAVRRAIELIAAGGAPSHEGVVRGVLRSTAWFGDINVAARVTESVEEPAFRILVKADIARGAAWSGDPSARARLTDAADELRKVKRPGKLGSGLYGPVGVLCEVASVQAAGGDDAAGREFYARAIRRAERDLSSTGGDAALCSIVVSQSEAGLPEDAWATFQKVPAGSPRYAECLAKIAAAVAEREAYQAAK